MRIQGYCETCRNIKHVRVRLVPPGSFAWGTCDDCEASR